MKNLASSLCASAALAAFSGLLSPTIAWAKKDSEDIVVTAPLEGAGIDSVQGTEILRRDDIVEKLNGGLGDTLDSEPGVSTTFFGAGASRPIIRGLGEDRVRLLENGIGAIDASTASPDHAVTADGLDASRIEILRGAAALAYGGNAIGGVINVIDETIPTRAVGGMHGDALTSYSSGNDGRQSALNVGADAGPLVLHLSGSARETEDYDIPGFARIDNTGAKGAAPNSWTSLRTMSGGASLVRDWGFVGAAVKRSEDNYGLPPEAPGERGGHIEMTQTRFEARGDVKLDLGPFNRVDFGFQKSDYAHTEFESDGAAGTRFKSSGWEGRMEAHHGTGDLKGVVGVQFTDVDFAAFGGEAFISPTNTKDAGVFVIERMDLDAWGLEGGARFEQRKLDNQTVGKRSFDSISLSGGVFARPFDGMFLCATAAYTERAPTQIELFAAGPHLATASYETGNSNLKQEEAFSIEASVRYDKGPLRIELNLFNMEFSNYIALVERGDVWWSDEGLGAEGFAASDTDPGIPTGANVLPVFAFTQKDARFRGGEVSIKSHLFDAWSFAFSGDVAMDIVEASFDGGGHPPRIPPRSLTLGLTAESDFWTARLEAIDTAAQERVAAFETATDGYTMLNASLAFRPFGEEKDISIRLDGRNLTDEEGRVHASFLKDELPLPGRGVRVTVSAAF